MTAWLSPWWQEKVTRFLPHGKQKPEQKEGARVKDSMYTAGLH